MTLCVQVIASGWPYIVAVKADGGDVVGYAYAAQYRARSAYRCCCIRCSNYYCVHSGWLQC